MTAATDQVRVHELTDTDGFAMRVGDTTLVHVSAGLPSGVRDAAARQLLRVVHSVGARCATAHLPTGAALTLPVQRGTRVIKRAAP